MVSEYRPVWNDAVRLKPQGAARAEDCGLPAAGELALTKDCRTLFVADHMNNVVWLVARRTDKVTARIGYLGRNGGGFNALHMIAVDS